MAWYDDTYRCSRCGELHEGVPMSYGGSAPTLWFAIPPAERAERAELSSDQCIIDDRYYFILGGIYIPVRDSDKQFLWLAWVSLSAENFVRASEIWNMHGR